MAGSSTATVTVWTISGIVLAACGGGGGGGGGPTVSGLSVNDLAMREDESLEFSQAQGNAIHASSTGGGTFTQAIVSVGDGTLSTGGQSINGSMTESAPGNNRHELTFRNIDEHDLNALLEGLIYTPDADNRGRDTLTLRTTEGGQTRTSTHQITVPVVDNPVEIMNFDGRSIYQYNGHQFVYTLNLNAEEYAEFQTDRLSSLDLLKTLKARAASNGIDIAAIDLTPDDGVVINDVDGTTFAGGKLVFQINEGYVRNRIDPADGGTYDPRVNYIQIRDSLGASDTGVYLDGTTLRYRADASENPSGDIAVASIAKVQRSGRDERGDYMVEYIVTFHQNPSSFSGNNGAWEALLKTAMENLLNIVEADPAHDHLSAQELSEDFNLDTGRITLAYIPVPTMVTVTFEDGRTGQTSAPKAVVVHNDQSFFDFTMTSTGDDANGYEVTITPTTFDNVSEGVPSVTVETVIMDGDNAVPTLEDIHPFAPDWDASETSSPDDDSGGPRIITYHFVTEQANLEEVKRIFDLEDTEGEEIEVHATGESEDKKLIQAAFASIEQVANIVFREQTTFNTMTNDLVLTTLNTSGMSAGFSSPRSIDDGMGGMKNIGNVSGVPLSAGEHAREFVHFVYLHEILHSIGLRHPGLQQGDEPAPYLSSEDAVYENTVMAYVSGLPISYTLDEYFPIEPQLYDIEALQFIYGANTSTRSDNTTYNFDATIEHYETIYDAGGTDTFNFNNPVFSRGVELDLAPGAASDLRSSFSWVFKIDKGTVIENAVGTRYADIILGNDADNELQGFGGGDGLDGRDGNDTASYSMSRAGVNVDLAVRIQTSTSASGDHARGDVLFSIENLIGSRFDDRLKGNRDHNRLEGREGNDSYTGDGGKDVFVVQFGTGMGLDTITDFQSGIDKLILEVSSSLANSVSAFLASIMNRQVTETRPDINNIELRMAGRANDGLNIQFAEEVTSTDSFHDALGGTGHLEIDVI